MQVWIVIDGEKRGPFADYDVRKKISEGIYRAETVAWHDGLSEWMPLARIPVFEREFSGKSPDAVEDAGNPSIPSSPVGAVPAKTFLVRRFWARWFDLYFFSGVLWLLLYALHVDVGWVLRDPWLMLFAYLPWVPIEAWLIARYATTPGKRLMGLRVLNDDGSKLGMRRSLERAFSVYFFGIGVGFNLLVPVCHLVSLFHVRATGKALWDIHAQRRVEGGDWRWFRAPLMLIALYVAMQMQFIVIGPYLMEEALKLYPELAEWIEKNPPQHLPKRH